MDELVTSRDGTTIAFERRGSGSPLILVSSALADRSDARRLARRLEEKLTVINCDRRGRGRSGDAPSYETSREVDDIEALIEIAGGRASLFGSSSGAVLALDAANRIPAKVDKVVLYEPPFITDGRRPPVPADLGSEISTLVAQNRRAAAVKLFLSKAMGIPRIGVFFMRIMPGWSAMRAMAHTIAYDLTLLRGTQDGRPLPAHRWSRVSAPVLVLTGGKSEPFFHDAASAIAALLPDARHRILEGQHHGSVVMGSAAVADAIAQFVGRRSGPSTIAEVDLRR